MKRLAIAVLVIVGCENQGPSSTPDLSTPDAAARCQLAAIRKRSYDQWELCAHPAVRGGTPPNKLDKPGFWDDVEKGSATLEGIKASDFTMVPVPGGKAGLGDAAATFRLRKNGVGHDDDFTVIRKDGHWYIVDTGV